MALRFRYKAVPSTIFGVVHRPIADVLIKCKGREAWISVGMLVDTGADYTILPKHYARLLGIDLSADCTKHLTHGVGGASIVYLCRGVRVRLGEWKRSIPLGFLDREDIPPLMGRKDFFETFKVIFQGYEVAFGEPDSR